VVYYKINNPEASQYKVNNHKIQLTSLARTTLRAVIGAMTLTDCNENRKEVNSQVEAVLEKETATYGVEVLRVEIQKIEPPQDVQASMNEVVKAEQEKISAINRATATETAADGTKRALIKEAEGRRTASILKAEGEAEAIKLVNESAEKYFKGNAQVLKKLETVERSLARNSKVILPNGNRLINVIGGLAGLDKETS